MIISYNWLLDLLHTNISLDTLTETLTDIGLEVENTEAIETIKGGLTNVVVGQVLTCTQHPDADRLRVTTVNVGAAEPLNIVCGAPNVAVGQKVIVAQVGAVLYPTSGDALTIKASKIRGVASEGMLCAEDELGIGASHAGIMLLDATAVVGTPAINLFDNYTDTLIHIGLTPNRADAASHYGVARDIVAAVKSRNLGEASLKTIPQTTIATGTSPITVTVANTDLCARYSGVVINNITVKESPAWLKNRLQAIGVRSVNNIVDVTNYVLHELGQPLHAFDTKAIQGNEIIIKTIAHDTPFVTLDGTERKLQATDLMVCNAIAPMCIAGVFGGKDSGVSATTTDIFIEAACFNPVSVRKTSKHHALKTDSSFRFERGTDPNNTVNALKHAIQLVLEVAGGNTNGFIIDVYPTKIENCIIDVDTSRINALIGKELPQQTIIDIIKNVGIEIIAHNDSKLRLSVPPYKVDVTREADVVEEVLRMYGANNIDLPTKFSFSTVATNKPDLRGIQNTVADMLVSNGFYETMNLSLTAQKYATTPEYVEVANPLSSELNILRTTHLHGALQTIAWNINRKQNNLKIFEFGNIYHRVGDKFTEQARLSILISGNKNEENWDVPTEKTNLFYLRSVVDNMLSLLNTNAAIKRVNTTNGINYEFATKTLVQLIEVDKKTLKLHGINQPVYYADIDWTLLVQLHTQAKVKYKEIAKFPEVRRDLSLLVDKAITFAQLKEEAERNEKKLLRHVNLFDVYEGDKLPEGKKSYALSFSLQNNDATLTDVEIDTVMQKIITAYESKIGAELRK